MFFNTKNITLFLLSATAASVSAQERQLRGHSYCPGASVTFVEATSPNATGLEEGFELFRELLGGENNKNKAGQQYGHRQINWDGGAVPFDMPNDFFAKTVPRGLTVHSKSNEFRVSNPKSGGDDKFSSINHKASKYFQAFSEKRLFTPVKENEFKIKFSVPGSHDEATVEGFGAVFVDVKENKSTKMVFKAESGCIIAEKFVDASSKGLSFLGAKVGPYTPPIYSVSVDLGEKALDERCTRGSYVCSFLERRTDLVVMDDFLYSEPQRKH